MGRRQAAAAAAAAISEAATAAKSTQAELKQLELDYQPRKGGTAKWKKGSKVLVPHTDQYYAAIVLQGQKRPDGQWYLLHYDGWSNKYNEWVEESGLVRWDKTLLEKSAVAAGNPPGDLAGRKRKADIAPAEPSLAVEIPQQLRLHIPPLLKKVVLDDSTQVNLKGTLLPLPRNMHGRPTVNDILKDYEAAVAKEVAEGEQQDPQKAEAVREMVAGLRAYFDQALRHCLLYSHEVQQADEALRGGGGSSGAAAAAADSTAAEGDQADGSRKAASDLYGAEHLVRLFVKLPELVPVAFMTPPDVVRLEQQLHDLMRRMTEVKRHARYFSVSEEYKPNPAYDPMLSLHLQPLLGGTSTAAAATAGGTPAPEARGGDGTPAPGTRGGSEAPDAMEQDT